jgi:cupin fold WbuC family metalloprotein
MFAQPPENSFPKVQFMKVLTAQDYHSLVVGVEPVSRICLHEPGSAGPQVMFIRLAPNITYPPHLHLVETEWYVLLDGEMFVTSIADGESDERRHHMSRSSGFVSIAIDPNVTHTVESGPVGATFLEVRQGPFVRSNTVFRV